MDAERIAELRKYVRGRADLSSEYLSEALAEIERLRVENAELRQMIRDLGREYALWMDRELRGDLHGTPERDRFESWLEDAVEKAGDPV